MTTALFGGSFDPVHLGHLNVVRSLLESDIGADRVIIMPAYVNPFKAGLSSEGRADGRQRYEMCRLAFGDIPCCSVSDFEISREGVSYTVNTLEHLKELYPDDRLILTVGSDSLATLPDWYQADRILSLAEVAAVSRSAEESERICGYSEAVTAMGGKVHILDSEPFDISSTEIRKKIMNNLDISCYVDKKVVEYIMCNAIYGKGDRI